MFMIGSIYNCYVPLFSLGAFSSFLNKTATTYSGLPCLSLAVINSACILVENIGNFSTKKV